MNKIIVVDPHPPKIKTVKMHQMKPLEIAVIRNSIWQNGTVVMRTASTKVLEVINLSNPRPDGCWRVATDLKVELLPEATLTVETNRQDNS